MGTKGTENPVAPSGPIPGGSEIPYLPDIRREALCCFTNGFSRGEAGGERVLGTEQHTCQSPVAGENMGSPSTGRPGKCRAGNEGEARPRGGWEGRLKETRQVCGLSQNKRRKKKNY